MKIITAALFAILHFVANCQDVPEGELYVNEAALSGDRAAKLVNGDSSLIEGFWQNSLYIFRTAENEVRGFDVTAKKADFTGKLAAKNQWDLNFTEGAATAFVKGDKFDLKSAGSNGSQPFSRSCSGLDGFWLAVGKKLDIVMVQVGPKALRGAFTNVDRPPFSATKPKDFWIFNFKDIPMKQAKTNAEKNVFNFTDGASWIRTAKPKFCNL